MERLFTAPFARQELRDRLAESVTGDADLGALVVFLRDDLAFGADNRSIIGPVLRKEEFDAWRGLMTGVRWNDPWPIDYNTDEVRALSRKLLTEMERA